MDKNKIELISDFVSANQNTSFKWGVFDCCVAISKVIEIQTELDLYEPYRVTYKTEKGSLQALKKVGSIESALDKHFNQINPNFMQRGDVAMMEDGIMAFRIGNVLVATTECGLKPVNTNVKIAWRVE